MSSKFCKYNHCFKYTNAQLISKTTNSNNCKRKSSDLLASQKSLKTVEYFFMVEIKHSIQWQKLRLRSRSFPAIAISIEH